MKYLLLLLLSGCGVHLSSDPIIVTHKIDISLIEPICSDKCKNDVNPDACTTQCINDFLLTLTGITVN